jgi:hypothetical protein
MEDHMNERRVVNRWLAVVALLLLLNLGVNAFSPSAQAQGKTQYRAVVGMMGSEVDADGVQQILNRQSTEGWQYVGSVARVMIFKK